MQIGQKVLYFLDKFVFYSNEREFVRIFTVNVLNISFNRHNWMI